MVRLYADENTRDAILQGLRRKGIDMITALEDGCSGHSDEEILRRATQLGRVLYSEDADILRIAVDWQRAGRCFCGINYGHHRDLQAARAIDDLETIAGVCVEDDLAHIVMYLPL